MIGESRATGDPAYRHYRFAVVALHDHVRGLRSRARSAPVPPGVPAPLAPPLPRPTRMGRMIPSRLALLFTAVSALALADTPPIGPDTPLETVLGKHGKEQLVRQLSQRQYGGKTWEWSQYAAWGHDLLVDGFVSTPPVGPKPSVRLSQSYRCVHCHNLVREDARLDAQDPETREKLSAAVTPGAATGAKRDGVGVALVPATTFWGAVNRDRFYNGFFSRYNSLRIADGTVMNPERLPEAVQVCSRYCSAGRYPEAWELDSLLAALWDLEIRLKDLDLTPETVQRISSALATNDPKSVEDARALVGSAYLRLSRATLSDLPKDLRPGLDVYAGGHMERGDTKRGEQLFRLSCGGCHGADVDAPKVASIAKRAAEDPNFIRGPRRGTERRGGPYMPPFTSERMSPRQLADIRSYLVSLRSGH